MKAISAALVKAQAAFEPATKDKTNPHFKSRYADLQSCLEAVRPALNAHGIMLTQETGECADGVIVETVFVHESGEERRGGKFHVPAMKQDPQGYGSALSYARRYSLLAACGITPEDDDDGNAASKPPSGARKVEPPPMPPEAIADWCSAISAQASVEDVITERDKACESARKAQDRAAYETFRSAAVTRAEQLRGRAKG